MLPVDEAVGKIVKAPFGTAHVLVVPKGVGTAFALHVVVMMCRLRRLSMGARIVVLVVGVVVLMDSKDGGISVSTFLSSRGIAVVVTAVVRCAINVIWRSTMPTSVLLSPTAVVALVAQSDSSVDALPE